jgi:hypothetical protein
MILFTSTLFGTNAAHALIRGAWIYALAFAALTVTSWWYHGTGTYDNETAYMMDQLAVLLVVLIGTYYVSKQSWSQIFLPVIAFVGVCVLYVLGFQHEIVHLVSAMGHHCIMAGI